MAVVLIIFVPVGAVLVPHYRSRVVNGGSDG